MLVAGRPTECCRQDAAEAAASPVGGVPQTSRTKTPFPARRYWTLGDEAPAAWIPHPNPLPSDCRYREDLMLLQHGDFKLGQQAKELLENLQARRGRALALCCAVRADAVWPDASEVLPATSWF